MIRLVIVAYPYEYRAEEVLDTLTHLRREDLADLDDAWYVSRGSDGRVRLHRPIDLPALSGATGARRDALVGTACLEPLLGGRRVHARARARHGRRRRGVRDRVRPDAGAGELGDPRVIRNADADHLLAELVLYVAPSCRPRSRLRLDIIRILSVRKYA